MSTMIRNAWLVEIDPPAVCRGELRIEGGRITATGEHVEQRPGDEIVDAGGAVVMPGLVNGHMHLYSTLAVGMPVAPKSPTNFLEILEYVWWRLDRALDLPSCGMSALVGGIEALRCGVTAMIDHHASPGAIDGSLDAIENGLRQAGVRGVLCYETTDRNGLTGRDQGLAENECYLKRCASRRDGWFAALVGAHAAFTMSDESLAACADLAGKHGVGVHIHVAEDGCDDTICRQQYGSPLLDRLERAGILALPSILGHGTNLTESDIERVNASSVLLAHNSRSNMNNAVGYAPLPQVRRPVVLGTDGIGSDMFAELQAAWYKSRDARAGLSPADCLHMLAQSARTASSLLGVKLGTLVPGGAADVVLTDYVPATPLTADNFAGHLIFGMNSRHVRSVMVDGQWRLRDRQYLALDESAIRQQSVDETRRLWERMAAL